MHAADLPMHKFDGERFFDRIVGSMKTFFLSDEEPVKQEDSPY